jgi:hypothetical protein
VRFGFGAEEYKEYIETSDSNELQVTFERAEGRTILKRNNPKNVPSFSAPTLTMFLGH